MTQNYSPNDAAIGRMTWALSLYGSLLLILAGLLQWVWKARQTSRLFKSYVSVSRNLAVLGAVLTFTRRDKHSFPGASVQAQPTASTTESKHIWIRIAGVPAEWDNDDIQDALQTIDADFDINTQLHNISLFPACFGDSQVALCEIDSSAGIISLDIKYPRILFKGRAVSLDIDCNFYDLTPLNVPEDPIVADVIAVTGLAGHAFGSWRSRTTGQMWLKDFLPTDIKRIRVMTYGYNSNLVGNTVEDGFLEYKKRFIHSILNVRQGFEGRPIIFIGHSMGGTLILQTLLQCKHGGQYRRLFDATQGICFFGTPHLGMDVGQILSMLEDGSTNVSQQVDLVRQLKEGSDFLHTQREDIINLWDANSNIKIISFFETEKTPTIAKLDSGGWGRTGEEIEMVSRVSAQLFWRVEERIPVSANHTNIVKFPSHVDLTYRTLVRHINECIASIVLNRRTENSPQDQITCLERPNIPFMVPYSRSKSFIGQEKSRNALNQELGPDDGHRRLAVWGLGGVGKTETILDYVYQFQHQKPIFWIHAGSRLKFEQGYRNLAQLALLPGHDDSKVDIRPLVRDWLEISAESGNWILVLDNADNLVDFFEQSMADNVDTNDGLANFIPAGSKGTVLVTTRDEVVALRLCDNQVLHKEAMDQEDAINLFRSLYPRISLKKSDAQPLDNLLRELSYLPLAIVQAASYLRENRLATLAKYLAQFQSTKKERLRLLSKPFPNLRRNPNRGNLETVLTTFTISFQQIEEQSPLAGSLLRVMACINRQGMPVKIFESVKRPNAVFTETVEEALNRMISFSLLTLGHESTVEMHALIHLSAQEYLTDRHELRDAARTTAVLVKSVLPRGEFHKERALWRKYLPHALASVNMLEELELNLDNPSGKDHTSDGARDSICNLPVQKNTVVVLELLDSIDCELGSYYVFSGQYADAERVYSRTFQVPAALYGKSRKGTLARMANLAATYLYQGRLNKAEELGMRALGMYNEVLGEGHREALTTMHNLALTYCRQGRWKKAEGLGVQAIETSKKVLGEEHPFTLVSMSSLAMVYYSQGRWKEAEELGLQAMEARKRVLGEEHPFTLVSMSNLAMTYNNQGQWKEAEELGLQAMETRKRVLGEEHPDTLVSMANLALTYNNQGQWKEAEELGLQVMETRKRVLGEEHPKTLTSMHNLACALASQQRLSEAISLMERVVERRLSVLDETHPLIVPAMEFLRRWKSQAAHSPNNPS